MKVKGLSPRTIKEYNMYWNWFDIEQLSQEYILEYLNAHKNNGMARAFVKNLIEYLMACESAQNIKGDLFLLNIPKIKRQRQRQKRIQVLSREEVYAMVNACGNNRAKLMILLTFYCGLRRSELIGNKFGMEGIKVEDFNWKHWQEHQDEHGVLKIKGKGEKLREVYVPPKIMVLLADWINTYFSIIHERNEPLFKMSKPAWEKMLHKASMIAIGRKVNPHLLRHSCSTYLYKELGWKIEDIKEYLGHEEIGTTMLYLHFDKGRLKEKAEAGFV